jgi:hypothetical protein
VPTPAELTRAGVVAHETIREDKRFTLYKTEFSSTGETCVVYRRCAAARACFVAPPHFFIFSRF